MTKDLIKRLISEYQSHISCWCQYFLAWTYAYSWHIRAESTTMPSRAWWPTTTPTALNWGWCTEWRFCRFWAQSGHWSCPLGATCLPHMGNVLALYGHGACPICAQSVSISWCFVLLAYIWCYGVPMMIYQWYFDDTSMILFCKTFGKVSYV